MRSVPARTGRARRRSAAAGSSRFITSNTIARRDPAWRRATTNRRTHASRAGVPPPPAHTPRPAPPNRRKGRCRNISDHSTTPSHPAPARPGPKNFRRLEKNPDYHAEVMPGRVPNKKDSRGAFPSPGRPVTIPGAWMVHCGRLDGCVRGVGRPGDVLAGGRYVGDGSMPMLGLGDRPRVLLRPARGLERPPLGRRVRRRGCGARR
jgi:hypothetical protein